MNDNNENPQDSGINPDGFQTGEEMESERNLPDVRGKVLDVGVETEYPSAALRPAGSAPATPEEVMMSVMPTASSLKITEEESNIIFAEVDDSDVMIRQDGMAYLPWTFFATRLRKAFGTEWAIVPESPMPRRAENNIIWGHYLLVRGVFISYALGEAEYHPDNKRMSWSDATETAVSNALMRCCKRFGMGSSLWDREFTDAWREKYGETYIYKGKTAWKKRKVPIESGQDPPADGSEAQASDPNAPPPEAPREDHISYWRSRAMATATNLSMSDDEVTALCKKHFVQVLDETTGKAKLDTDGKPLRVTEKKQLTPKQWRALALELHKRWLEAGKPKNKRPESDKPETEEDSTSTESPETQDQPDADSESASTTTIMESIGSLSELLEVDLAQLIGYLQTNYVADLGNLSADKAEGIADFLRTISTDNIIRDRVKKDIEIWHTWFIGLSEDLEAPGLMIHSMSLETPEILNRVLERFRIKTLRGMTSEMFLTWNEALDEAIAEDMNAKKFDEEGGTGDFRTEDDIPF